MVPRLRSRVLPVLILLAVAAPGSVHAQLPPDEPGCPISFHVESADTLGAVGFQTSLVTDPEGLVHVAYRNGSGSQIRYARQEAQGWTVQLLPQPGISRGLSLALDPTGVPTIGYGAQELTSIGVVTSAKIARWAGDRWATERIENAFPGEVAIGFDRAGVLHAVYFAFTPAFVIRYATRTADGWVIETLFPTGGFGAGRFSLAFDAQDRPHVTAQVLQVPLHAVRTETGWVIDRQPPAELGALVLDAGGVPHVAAHLRTPPVVQYRTRANGIWSIETVDSVEVGSDRAVSLALDRFGRPFLSYYDAALGRLVIAWKDRGVWQKQDVDAGGAGEAPSLALVGGAQPRISYMDPLSFDLRISSGEIAPPNHAPTADASGPYAGTIGQALAFDAGRSTDPDGDGLAYSWDFGDGIQGRGRELAHTYGEAGAYRVCLTVTDEGCPPLQDSTCVTATVQEFLAARVFRLKEKKIELTSDGTRVCFELEPVAQDFLASDLDASTVVAKFGTAQVSPALERKSTPVTDSDGNGAPEAETCFSTPALRELFATAPPGKSQVTFSLEGALRSGARVRGEIECEIQKHQDCRDGCASVSPNPLNPNARITFTLFQPGSVQIDLFDAQGRRIGAILGRTFLQAGEHEQRIEARDPWGRPLSSGVYFYQIQTPQGNVNGRFTILK